VDRHSAVLIVPGPIDPIEVQVVLRRLAPGSVVGECLVALGQSVET